MPVSHVFVSAIAPVADTTLVRPNNWNDAHVVSVDLTSEVTGVLGHAHGGTDSQFFSVAGPTALRTYTFPDANSIMVSTDAAQALTNKVLNASLNTVSNLDTTMFAANVIDTDPTLAANSDLRIPTQKATKSYIDNLLTGLSWKQSVRIATTTNDTLSGLAARDGVTPIAGDRILAKNQTTATQNGLYVAAAGAWARSTDADTGAELVNATVFVQEGTNNADTQWTCSTNAPITIGVTNITFAQVSGAGTYSAGTGLTLSGNQFSINVAYVGQTSITTLGTITTGTWNGTDIAFANIAQLAGLSVLGVAANSTADMAAITAGTDDQVLRRSGTSIGFGAINLAAAAAVTGLLAISNIASGFVKVDGSTPLTASWAAGQAISATQLDSDNLRLDGNTFSSTDTNGNILVFPNGSGNVRFGGASNYIQISSAGTMTMVGTADYRVATNFYAFKAAAAALAGLAFMNTGGNRFVFFDTGGNDLLAIPLTIAVRSTWGYAEPSISPAQITADQNNYSPTNAQRGVWYLDLDANHIITGLQFPLVAEGKHLEIYNVSTSILTLTHEDGASSAVYRMQLPGGVNFDLGPNEGMRFRYSDVTTRWIGSRIATAPSAINGLTGVIAAGGTNKVFDDTTFDGGLGGTAYTINDLVYAGITQRTLMP